MSVTERPAWIPGDSELLLIAWANRRGEQLYKGGRYCYFRDCLLPAAGYLLALAPARFVPVCIAHGGKPRRLTGNGPWDVNVVVLAT